MKYLVFALPLLLIGCTQTFLPTTSNGHDWQHFGEQSALDGQRKLSEINMREVSSSATVNVELYSHYEQGYELGLAQYCNQNARILGISGQPYLGICDKIDFWFQRDYDEGRRSMSSI